MELFDRTVPTTIPELDLKTLFPFELDRFQQEAIAALNADCSVVVCAPTGSGKTLIGEYAIYRALSRGKRVFYTTPLKALSNQKLRDFRDRFGADRVGLLTGDTSINRDAPVLVMTTEIFRNMLYGTRIGEVGTSLTGVEAVVLDECHYMNDRQRGTVWEESIIYCPHEIQLVALSATVANSDQLTDWLNRVHGPTKLIYSDFRPVPLQFHFCNPKGLFPLLDDSQKKINPRLKPKRPQTKEKGKKQDSPSLVYVLSHLWKRDMLPAIYFIFSRRGCDKAVDELREVTLVNEQEAKLLKQKVEAFLAHNPEAARSGGVEPLLRGISSHHAGILPAWKGLVEELFQEGLVKVVFATETLAAGINMPARTTVVSSLSKRTDRGHRLLTPSEFMQMSGRAGRRGMDTTGHVVTLQTPFEGSKEAAYLATNGPDPLVSQFTPSYGMVLNLLQTHSLEEARELVERSFGQYLATVHLEPTRKAIADLSEELAKIEADLASVDDKSLQQYEKLQERLREERRLLKILQTQAEAERSREIAMAIASVEPGTLLSLKGKHIPVSSPVPAVLVTKTRGSGQSPYLICLGADNRWYVVTAADVVACSQLPRVSNVKSVQPPPEMPIKPGHCKKGTESTEVIARQIGWACRNDACGRPDADLEEDTAPEVVAQQQQVAAVEAQLQNHPAHQWGNPAALLKRQQRREGLLDQISQLQSLFQDSLARHWEEFMDLIEILQRMGGLEGVMPTPLGEAAAAIRGDNELWMALALMSGKLDELDPHHLAAACASFVTETMRPDSWTHYDAPAEMDEALGGLRGLRRNLFQLQRRYRVALPVWMEYDLTGLVEQWALGVQWDQLCSNTSLDEGDVVRVLRRTVDFLSQIPHVPHISDSLQRNAYRAIHLIDRFPVNEVVA
ncbi:RNA helicase [Coleofasciculus sp. FACHB-64]|uniref:DEAD/DEAH box helicase n=1 Tax=Cyanophyceae TaxID=3028117 RepID=UPI001687741F|nr:MULTISPECIES: RNA helicase [unclassified Coleofasciculus]MBD1837893.1 RNA helicase [Coleofasciculus sp. FACHB-501]MBD1879395.1 RNA helicase [Coleofasciculus sp. FACHB-T130]MBD1888929.1 RNA helicase [Coleofasciculus sp. FACHB-SPT9]MBD1897212.1 RNA helicase [Coleofasciculus sp. FACHB-129]MBD2046383.1 RNA helicase [Coleofasciculus sp. FACHB-64]